MFAQMMLLNNLGSVDIGFFVGCAVAIVLVVAIYFLIPVFNKKQYREQRENLKKREEAFKSYKGISAAQDESASADVLSCENKQDNAECEQKDSRDEIKDGAEG